MSLTITKSYSAGNPLLEAHVDNFRNGLLTQFNTTKFGSSNFSSTMALTSSKFQDTKLLTSDNSFLNFGASSNGLWGIDSSKDLVFDTVNSSTPLTFKAVSKTLVFKSTELDVPGEIVLGAGGSGYGVLRLLSTYKRPTLEYQGSNLISVENNTATANQTLVAFPACLIAVTETIDGNSKTRRANINVTANGHNATDTGAARGGLRSGLVLTANTWYAVYAAKVRYGSDAGNRFILVFDDTLPTQANEATLNTRYGQGYWVYMGLIRYGYGATGTSTAIIPFQYTNKGWCFFTSNDGSSQTGGLVLAQSTTNADDSALYTVTDGMGSTNIPTEVIVHAYFNVFRTFMSDWSAKDASGNVIWRGGWHDEGDSEPNGHHVELNVEASMSFAQTRVGTGAADKRVCLTAFCDKHLNSRRHGISI